MVSEEGHQVETVVEVSDGRALPLRLEGESARVTIESPGTPSSVERQALVCAARRVLNLDADLEPFYRAVRADPEFAWIAAWGAGRLLRGATAFEDLLKLVLTTNCCWSLTMRMTAAVTAWGPAAEGTRRAFPSAFALRDVTEAEFRRSARLGYRAPYVTRLVSNIVTGVTDPESWQADPRPATELRRDIDAIARCGAERRREPAAILRAAGWPGARQLASRKVRTSLS